MVYKKYVYRGGKRFGPYYCESYRDKHGKVKTRAVDSSKKIIKKRLFTPTFFLVVFFIFLIILGSYFIYKKGITGKLILFQEENLVINLKEGELLPINSKLVIEQNNTVMEYLLSEFIESNAEGNFYIENKKIDGEGAGYGIEGEKITYPIINFKFKVIYEEVATEETEEGINETSEVSEEPEQEENETEESEEEEAEENADWTSEETEEPEVETEEETNEPGSESSITGAAVSEEEVEGKVSKDKPFVYDTSLEEYEVEIIEVDKGNINDLEISKEEGKLVITTDYYEVEKGFGEGYLTDKITSTEIGFDELGVEKNSLVVSLVYQEEVLAEISKETLVNESLITEINETRENLSVTTKQYKAIIGKPVKWLKIVNLEAENNNLTIELPKEAENISVKTGEEVQGALQEIEEEQVINNADRREIAGITGDVSLEIKKGRGILIRVWNWMIKITVTGKVIGEEELAEEIAETEENKIIDLAGIANQTPEGQDIAVEYYTEAPQAFEDEISETKKQIIISAPSELNYTDILAYTELLTEAPEQSVKLYWIRYENLYSINNETGENITEEIEAREEVNITKYDLNENNLTDYIEWIVPHLSNQTYELIIEISKAEHLDENRSFISDIYNDVKEKDNNWSEVINNSEYVRVTFEQNLTNKNDITIYARASNWSNETGQECYDNETQILTENGWKLFNELNKDINVVTLNQKTKELEYQKLIGYQEFNYNDEMYKIILEDDSTLLVTKEHKIYVNDEKNKKENATENVASKVTQIFTDYNNSNNIMYINLSKFNNIAEAAPVASMVMHQSEKLGLHGLLGSIPNWSASASSKLINKDLPEFSLEKISEIYSEISLGEVSSEDLIFLDENLNEIKVKLITKVLYSGKIYDVDVENDIVLVRRNSEGKLGRAVWSGNSNPENKTTASIEVYIKDSDSLIAKFENITTENWYKIYLTNLSEDYSGDVFDLKIIGDNQTGIEFDYIVDPVITISDVSIDATLVNITAEVNFTHLNISTIAPYDNLSLYWPFDSNISTTTVYDYTKNNKDGTIKNSAYTSGGVYGGAMEFKNNGNVTTAAAVITPSVSSSNFSFGGWIKWYSIGNNPQSYDVPIGQAVLGNDYGDFFIQGDSSNVVDCWFDTATTNGYAISTNTWYHVMCVRNGSTGTLYVNGVSRGVLSAGGAVANTPFKIGNVAGSYQFNGTIDEVMVFNTSLTAAQVLAIFNNQSSRFLASGTQAFANQSKLNISTGNNQVQVTGDYGALQGSSINLSVGYYAGSWAYTTPQVYDGDNVFTISTSSTNLTLNFTFYAGNSTNPFYSPILSSAVNALTLNITAGVTFCGTLNQENTIYTQQANIIQTANADCIVISAQNITYNGNGYWINQSTGYDAIYSNQYNTTIKNCNLTGSDSSSYGINLNGANNSYIFNNTIKTYGYGINLNSVSNTIIENNTQSGSSNVGLYLSGSNNNIIRGNSVTNNYDYDSSGIQLITSSNNNTITNNTLQSNGNEEIQISGDNNTITNNSIWNCSTYTSVQNCIIVAGNNNIFDGNKINKSVGGGITIAGNNSLFKNTNMTNISGTSVSITSGTNNTFLNFSYYNESVVSGSQLIRKWHYRAYVNDSSNNNMGGVNVTAYNRTGAYQLNLTTDSTGYTQLGEIIDYVNNGTRTYYSPYNIYAGNSTWRYLNHSYNATLKQSNYQDVFEFRNASTTLSAGWNTIAFTMYNVDTGTNRNITLVTGAGANFIGFSGSSSFNVSNMNFTNSSGWTGNWSTAVSNNKVQAYFQYYEGSVNKYAATPDLGMDSYALSPFKGYFVTANQPGNLTLPGVGGTLTTETYNFNDLRFSNGTNELNISEANNATYDWMFMAGDAKLHYVDDGDDKIVCETVATCDKTTLSPWEGYYIWSNKNNLQIIRKN